VENGTPAPVPAQVCDQKKGAGPPAEQPTEGCDQATGKFLAGNKGGPGRPRNPWTRELARRRQVLLLTLNDKAFCQLVDALHAGAWAGDMAAAKLPLSYALGKPTDAPAPDGCDQDEWDRVAAEPTASQVTRAMLDHCDPVQSVRYILALAPEDLKGFQDELV